MSKKEMKLCENCKHMVEQKGVLICRVSLFDCLTTRSRYTACSYDAEWFEPKEEK